MGVDDLLSTGRAWKSASQDAIKHQQGAAEMAVVSIAEAAAPQFDVLEYLDNYMAITFAARQQELAEVVGQDLDAVIQLAQAVNDAS